ncbi:30S ribosomal protein S21 [Candidatus Berkelbacteria bacterium CG10_big_fil_rev_8_21_14_0_10_41_12]|uniref:Small ribosomal subunit protein bS21 n=1 Tax=Candidatus Berkelbacteria bacterium CG10_big_fil_rev_8_21_14_0_10_41_12 TaxID=1974513 RepID=A0A2M6WXP4_9BACT|nr:MAG: 30S ribosomal protein S21 [Candidatus Berkelbacteria bacterium CG10_big_fil_rev_8_21_14_0_10_41_12]
MLYRKTTSAKPEVVIRKFFREVQQSGLLTDVKKRKYHEKKPSRLKRRETAQRKNQRRSYRQDW